MPTVIVGGVPGAGSQPHIVGSSLSGQRTVGFYPGVSAFGAVTIRAVYRISPTSLGSAGAFGAVTPLQAAQIAHPAGLTGEHLFGQPRILVTVEVGGVGSAQQFGIANIPQYVQIPGLNHGLLHYHIVGSYLAGEALVGFYGEYLFGRPTIRIAFLVPGVGSAQRFGQIVLGTQHRVPGVPSAQQFGVPWIAFEQFQPVPGLGTAQSFGVSFAYRVWFHPPRPPDEISLTPVSCDSVTLTSVACADTLLVPAAWTEETLPPSDEQDLALVPSVEE
jgi:hypothetical protein